MLPEFLKEIYRSPKSTLVGLLAGLAGVVVLVVQGLDKGFDQLDPSELVTVATLLVGMVVGMLKKDKKK